MDEELTYSSERIVAGGPGDFMEARHLTLAGSNAAIGRHLALVARDRLGCRKRPWTDPEATRAQKEFLTANWPGHAERARGAAAALGVDPDDDRIDTSFLYYQWSVPGCSVAFYPPPTVRGGHAILARNYDFSTGGATELLRGTPVPDEEPATSRPFIMEVYPDEGHPTLSLCSYELLGGATDGINSEGLSVALLADVETLTIDYRPLRTNAVGLSEIQLVRFLLETCRDAADAREALARVPHFYIDVPCHYMVADAAGDSFVFELGFTDEARFVEGAGAGVSSVTNHLLCRQSRGTPQIDESVGRRAALDRAVAAAGPRRDLTEIEAASRSVAATAPAGVGQYASASLARTLWHAFYDLTERALAIDFYLGEGPAGIRRSSEIRVRLDEGARADRGVAPTPMAVQSA